MTCRKTHSINHFWGRRKRGNVEEIRFYNEVLRGRRSELKGWILYQVEGPFLIWKGQNTSAKSYRSNWIPSPWSGLHLGCRRIKRVISKFLQVPFFNDSWNFQRLIQMKHMPSLKANLPQKKPPFTPGSISPQSVYSRSWPFRFLSSNFHFDYSTS